jgi:HlyD family secretion protein
MSDSSTTPSSPPANVPGLATEQLDTLVRVTTAHAWISLGTLFVLCAAAVVFSIFYRVPKKVVGEGILLIEHDRLSQIRALGTGRLLKLRVALGDEVHPGTEIGQISQADLQDTIDETKARIRELEKEDVLLTEFERNEKQTQEQAIARLKESIHRTIDNATEGLGVALKIVDGSHRLRLISQLSNLDYLKDLQQKYTIQNDLNNGQTKLAEVDLTWLTSENQRHRVRLQRRLEISRLQTKLRLEEQKYGRTSRIISHAEGKVTQILTAADQFVQEGAPIVLLSSPKSTEPGTDDVDLGYDSIVFVPAGEGKKIDKGHVVEVMPATVKREEHGFIRGKVVAVSELPATRLAMEAALQHPDLVDTFLKRYAPGVLLRIHVKLDPDPAALADPDGTALEKRNGFLWSSSSGARQRLKTGTMCEAAIVVEQQRLITLVIPWLKHSAGAY